jgi:ubiquinone/menaquinone biosynthesis C-methylase UbiE
MKKLNLGCACRFLEGYINIDMDSIEDIKHRYPNVNINDNIEFIQANVLELPFDDESIDEVRCDALVEHFSFKEESLFFNEVNRVLKSGGNFNFSTPDFDETIRKWTQAKDDWKEFFRNDEEAIRNEHWFGNNSYSTENKWGYLTACIFGTQNGVGQFHKNAYTEDKIIAICKAMDFTPPKITRFIWKKDRDIMLQAETFKK